MKRLINTLSLSLVLLMAFGCKKADQPTGKDITFTLKATKGTPLAQVGGSVLTLEELSEDFLGRQGTFRGAPHLNTDKKKLEYTENAANQRAMMLEGIATGLLDDPAVKRDVEKIIVQKLMRTMLTKAQEEYVASEAEMKEHYEKNPNLYNRQEAVKVAYFSVPFGANKEESKKFAAELQKDALQNVKNANTKEFARLAMKHAQMNMNKIKISLETNESSFLEKPDFDAKFGKDSFDLVNKMENMGQVGPVLTTDNGYFVIMKTGYRKALNESFEEAKPKIQKRIAYEQRGKVYEKFMADLRKKYDIKIFQDRIADLGKNAAPIQNPTATANAANPVNGLPAPTEHGATQPPAQVPNIPQPANQQKPAQE